VKAIRAAVRAGRLVVIDEIGPMEIRSGDFRDAVIDALDSELPVLATIFAHPLPFIAEVKKRSNVTIYEVRSGNRTRLVSELVKKFGT